MSGLSTLSKQIAKHGRYGDDEILHISKAEIAGLDTLARSIYGHPLTYNPATGQKEAFLFLPFLAPLLASAGVLGAGMTGLGALGTGLLAGGAGALEASARGMDDPLKQGLMAGLTAGAGSALTSGIMGAAGQPGFDAAANSMASSMGGGAQTADMLAQNMAAGATPSGAASSLFGSMGSTPIVNPTAMTEIGSTMAQYPNVADHGFAIAAERVAPTLQQAAAPSALDLAGPSTTQFGTGLKNLATDDKALGAFLSAPATKGAAIAGATGLAGMSQLDYEAKTKAENDAREAEKQQKYNVLKNQIRQRYADAGRTGWWGQPGVLPGVTFADGGQIPQTVGYTAADQMRSSSFTPFVSTAAPQFAKGGQVFPMQAGGFVLPKYAVDAVGGGNNDRGLVALKRKVGATPIRGKGTGVSDSIPAKIDGKIPAKVSNGEAYVSPKGVKKAGGSKQLYTMMAAAKKAQKG